MLLFLKNTQDLSLLFVLHKNDIQQIVPYILVEEAFQMIDIFMDASSHYGQAVDSSTYFELALLKICNQIENEHKEVASRRTKSYWKCFTWNIGWSSTRRSGWKPVEKIQEPVIEPQEYLQEKVEEKKEPKVEQVETPVEESKEEVKK